MPEQEIKNNSDGYNQSGIDSEWVKKIRSSNTAAFESLFNFYCQKLINFSRRYVWDKQTAENIVQDIFLKIWQNRNTLDPSKMIKTYLFTAVKNESLKHLRHADVHKRWAEFISLSQDSAIDPEKTLSENETKKEIENAISSLPEKCREIFTMNKFDKLKYREIAEILNISVKTVETQMGRALKKLREKLKTIITLLFFVISLVFILFTG